MAILTFHNIALFIIKNFRELVNENFHWTEEMQIIGDKLQKLSSILNCVLENELGDKILL